MSQILSVIRRHQLPAVALLLVAAQALAAGEFVADKATRVDEPGFAGLALPAPDPAFPNCPAGFFVALVEDGPESGLSPGIFGLNLLLDPPGTQRLEGGLNFGGLLDGSQAAFAGFNIQNSSNEPQRLELTLNGNPANDREGLLPVRIQVLLNPAVGVFQTLFETTATLSLAQPYTHSLEIQPGFHVVTIAPTGAASVPGGAADGEIYVSLLSQFVDRPGGGFFGGAVVGGYHAPALFGGSSGFAAFCLGSAHTATAQVFAAPTYGASGARDLRLRLQDYLRRDVYDSSPGLPVNVQGTLRISNGLDTYLYAPALNDNSWNNVLPLQTVDLNYSGPNRGRLKFRIANNRFGQAVQLVTSDEIVFTASGQVQVAMVRHNNVAIETATAAVKSIQPVALYSPQIDQRNPSPIGALFFDGLLGQEELIPIPSLAGLVTVRNNTLLGNPRAYYLIGPEQTARVRAIDGGTGIIATILEQSFQSLSNAASGNSTAVVTSETFGPTTSFCPSPVVEVPGCVSAGTSIVESISMDTAGRQDSLKFTLCANYSGQPANTLRLRRPTVFCTLPFPAPCPANSGLNISIARLSTGTFIGPTPLGDSAQIDTQMSGPAWSPGETYCVTARQVSPFEGAFPYEFSLLGNGSN
ncbi:MAG: hypothetical protein AB7E72_17665 [Lysobacterales bacterium]